MSQTIYVLEAESNVICFREPADCINTVFRLFLSKDYGREFIILSNSKGLHRAITNTIDKAKVISFIEQMVVNSYLIISIRNIELDTALKVSIKKSYLQ